MPNAAERLGVEMVITLGALLAEVAHTLPVPITGLASDDDLVEVFRAGAESIGRTYGTDDMTFSTDMGNVSLAMPSIHPCIAIDAGGVRSIRFAEPTPKLCLFEFVYLSRADSRMFGRSVHEVRREMGRRLSAEAPVDADLVLPIPDSGTPAAIGFSRATGIPFSEGLIKNRYVGRTFIQPDQTMREQGIRMKFNPLAEVAGKRLVVIDDSIVRGNTTRQIVAMLFEAGAAEVHVRISSPPVIGQCYYGIDLADPDELVASARTVEEVREHIGATTLAYLSLDGLQASTRRPASALCRACLTREYPTPVPDEAAKLRFEPAPTV